MRLEDVTPEWVRTRMQAQGLLQRDVAREIGLPQHKLSKSLNFKRQFTLAEREALIMLLCEPSPPELDPQVLEFARRYAALPEPAQRVVQSLVGSLEQESLANPSSREPSDDHAA